MTLLAWEFSEWKQTYLEDAQIEKGYIMGILMLPEVI